MTGPLLRCAGLVRLFGALRAVDEVDLEVAAGTRHALIGPNGAGKSTLFRIVTGGLAATSGTVWLDGRDITRLAEHQRARLGIGQTFQHTSLFPSMTAAENVALAAQRLSGRPWWPLPRRRIPVDRLLADVGMADRAGVTVEALSYGECRRLEVAVALATGPRLLLLDEPAAGMSPAESAPLLRALPPEVTVLFVEHDLDLVFELATRVTVMHLGRILVSGTPDEVRASPQVQQAYLGSRDVSRRE
ncbi:MAG TPA: ABC transporter ATP-binding protein [Candidatus Limnocylindrales bacterium]|nr:ABC transporter ATP-binding protein [Candidatus Limnocylindrales bacterium]